MGDQEVTPALLAAVISDIQAEVAQLRTDLANRDQTIQTFIKAAHYELDQREALITRIQVMRAILLKPEAKGYSVSIGEYVPWSVVQRALDS